MSVTSIVAKNTAAQIFSKAINIVLGMTLTFLLTHHPAIGRTGFGIYTFALIFTGIFGTVGDWGLNLIAVREGSKDPQKAPEILGNILTIRFVLAILAGVASIVAISLLPNYSTQIRQVTIIASFSLLAMSLKTSLQTIFTVKQMLHRWAVVEVVANAVALLSIGTVLAINPSLPVVMFIVVLENFFAAGLAFLMSRKLMTLKLSLWRPLTKFLLLESFSMGLVGGILTIYNRADTIILSIIKDSGQVADYALAYKLFDVVYIFGAYFSASLLPVISSVSLDRERLSKLLNFAITAVFSLGIVLTISTVLFAPLGIYILGGAPFSRAVPLLQILGFVLPVALFNQLFQYVILSLGKQKQLLKVAVMALVINITFNLIFIPIIGTPAAALSTFVTEIIILTFGWRIIKKDISIVFSIDVLKENYAILYGRLKELFLNQLKVI